MFRLSWGPGALVRFKQCSICTLNNYGPWIAFHQGGCVCAWFATEKLGKFGSAYLLCFSSIYFKEFVANTDSSDLC